jgi:hypothetical protein
VLASLVLAQNSLEQEILAPVSARTIGVGKSWYAVTNTAELANSHTAAVWCWLEQVASGSS